MRNYEIKQLSKEGYSGYSFTVTYQTDGYYKIEERQDSFSFQFTKFEDTKEYILSDEILAPWMENPVAYGAFDTSGNLLAVAEGYLEEWNNRYRISNIVIFDCEKRGTGLGSALFEKMIKQAKESGARMVFLETQSCNEKAIAFYKKHGFKVIGFDQYAYSNDADETHEMLVWMGMEL